MHRASRSLAAGFALALLAACSPDIQVPVGPSASASPKFKRDVLGSCDTIANIAVNDWVLPLRPGLAPLAPGIADGQVLFQGTQVMFGGGLLYGTSPADGVVGYNTATGLSELGQGSICTDQTTPFVHTVATVSPNFGVAGPAGLTVTQESFAWPNAPDNGYVLLKYTFSNTGHQILSHLYSGWVADWDVIFDGDPSTDAVRYNARLGIGEVSESDTLTFPAILGVVPVGPSGIGSFAGYANVGVQPTIDADFFGLLTGGINLSTPVDPNDVREEMGLGAVTLLPNHSTVAYFAIVGGANRAEWEANVAAARAKAAQLGFCGNTGAAGLTSWPTVRCQ
ncbi:MAG TPA: hypothetical protein VJN62_10285 [Gemmatimonadales bacterium]|nr:hypothetical protein [Gemmatimonadales bacterium]